MDALRKILVVLDPALRPSVALARAEALAERSGAALHLALVEQRDALTERGWTGEQRVQQRRAREALLAPHQAWLEAERDRLRARGIAAEVTVAWGKPLHDEVVWLAHEVGADALVKEVATEGAPPRLLRPPEDWHLLRGSPVPVLLVNQHASGWPQRVIAAVDPYDAHGKPHELNRQVLEAALALARLCQAELHVVHALDYAPMPVATLGPAADAASQREFYEQLLDARRRELAAFSSRFDVPRERTHLLEGRPAEAIATYANATLGDLVVLGTARRHGLARLSIGTTSESIVHRLRCDVLVVKSEAQARELRLELEERHPDPLEAMEV